MNSATVPEPEQLLADARAGDGAALGRLLARYEQYLSLLARLQIGKRLQGKVGPDDLVQEVFLEAHRHFGVFAGRTEVELTAWLRQILAGVLANTLRRYIGTKARDIRLERELTGELDQSSRALDLGLADSGTTPSNRAAGREQAVLLAEALGRLPGDYRDIIVLRHLEGLPFAEVARRMERSEDSVQKLWVRALAKLRQTLGGER